MLQVFPKYQGQNIFEERGYPNIVRPSRLRGHPKLSFQSGIGKVVGHSILEGLLYFYDDEMQVADSARVDARKVAVPYSGSFVYYVNDNTIVRWNLVTGEKKSNAENPDFIIEPGWLHGSANGLVSYFSINSQLYWDRRQSQAILNTNDNTFLEKTDLSFSPTESLPPYSRILSDDGRFCLRVNDRLISKAESALTPIGYLPFIGAFVSFRPDNNDEIILAINETISILNSNDLQLLRTITMPPGYQFSSYDPVSHYVVCTKMYATVVYLINIDTNDSKTVPAYSTEWTLMNGYLFNFGREYIKVL